MSELCYANISPKYKARIYFINVINMAKNKIPSFQKGKRKQKKYSGVSYAEVPADILALKPKVMEFFAQNINKNFLEFASKISG